MNVARQSICPGARGRELRVAGIFPRCAGMKRFLSLALAILGFVPSLSAASPVGELRLIGVQTIAREKFSDTVVSGLSGIDYDAAADRWVAISDDKSEQGPGRYYTLQLDYDATGFRAATVVGMQALKQPGGRDYPNEANAQSGDVVPDFEAIRLDPRDGSVWYTHEGLRRPQTNPFVRQGARDGRFVAEWPVPAQLLFAAEKGTGARFNETFEGLSFAPGGATWWIGMEGALQQDRAPAGSGQRDPVRFTELDRAGRVVRQVAYGRDPVVPGIAEGEFADSGVSEILAVSPDTLLVLERSGSRTRADKVWRFGALLFEADVSGADDVSAITALGDQPAKPAAKRLLYDFSRAGLPHIDNLEGLAFGRKLSNGHDTLVVLADDNFAATQVNQVWVFEIVPPAVSATKAVKPKRNWDDFFEGVVHDERRIAGFVGEYRWLSNYLPCPVTYEGRRYTSSEAAYHASKYPEAERDEFTRLDPDPSKKLSRKKGVDQAWWDARKERVMREISWAKFSQNPELAAKLLATGDRVLEETNWWGDKYWGVVAGEGQNMLGKILMDVRAQLRAARPAGE